MKFGRQFESYKIPEWFEYYLDYNKLKTVLKFIDNRQIKRKKLKKLKMMKSRYDKKQNNLIKITDQNNQNNQNIRNNTRKLSIITTDSFNSSNQFIAPNKLKKIKSKRKRIMEVPDLSLYPDDVKILIFLGIYKSEIKKIDEFFSNKLIDFIGELSKIEFRMNLLENSSNDESYVGDIKSETDELGYAVSWKRALSTLYNLTSWLHSYHSINSLAILKIKKKAIKIFGLNNIKIDDQIENVSKEFDFYGKSLNNLIDLRVKIRHLYSIKFMNGNEKETKNELEKRLLGEKKKTKPRLFLFFLGLFIAFIFTYVVVKHIDGKNKNDSFKPFFPFFNFSYIMILVLTLMGINMKVLQYYKINYVYLLDLNPKNKINPYGVFEGVLGLAALWMFFFLMMKLSLKFGLFGGEYTLYPLLINLSFIIFLFLPFHVLYLHYRKGLIKVMIKLIFPIGKNGVRFKDSLLGDILISLSEPFKNLILGYCLMVCNECYLNNSRGPCTRETIPCWIIWVYPQFIRLTQNINRLYFTRLYWPYLGNVIKYSIRFTNNSLGFFYERDKGTVLFYFRVFVGAISTSYNIFWDIYVDWGLLRKNNKNFLLREKITFPLVLYYIAVFYDIIIRAAWTWYFIPIRSELLEWKYLLKDTLEVMRRGLWALIRIENENLTNPEYYRSFLIIPELPEEQIY